MYKTDNIINFIATSYISKDIGIVRFGINSDDKEYSAIFYVKDNRVYFLYSNGEKPCCDNIDIELAYQLRYGIHNAEYSNEVNLSDFVDIYTKDLNELQKTNYETYESNKKIAHENTMLKIELDKFKHLVLKLTAKNYALSEGLNSKNSDLSCIQSAIDIL